MKLNLKFIATKNRLSDDLKFKKRICQKKLNTIFEKMRIIPKPENKINEIIKRFFQFFLKRCKKRLLRIKIKSDHLMRLPK